MKTCLISISMFLLCVISLSCRGPEGAQGPVGPSGSGSATLVDPTIMPKVIATYPPAGTQGPFDELTYYQIQIRFNKIMDPVTVRRAITVSSTVHGVHADMSSFYNLGGDLYFLYVSDSNSYEHQWSVGEICTVKVDSTAKDINGNFLKPAYSMTFVWEPKFRVKSISPASGSTGISPTQQYIYIYFNGKVDTSIYSTIQLSPAVPGYWYYNYDSSSIYRYMSSSARLASNTTYTITINTNAHDKQGHHLQQAFASTFTTSPFTVTYTYPSNGAGSVSSNLSSIEVEFTTTIDTGSVRGALSISPPIPGSLSMYSGNTWFSYTPSGSLTPGTNYVVTISTRLRSLDGDTLKTPYTFSFTTAPFMVTGTSPGDGDVSVSRYQSVALYFSAYIDTAAARSSFSISPAVDGTLTLYTNSNYFYFYPSTGFAANTEYTVTISDQMRSSGGYRLQAPYVLKFTTGD